MQIYCIHIEQLLDETFLQEMIHLVSPEKQSKIHRFRKPVDAIRSLLGDVIIRFILCKHYGFHNDEITYAYQEFGKPYLLQHPNIHFNISHSGDWVAGVVATDPVGIDIEKITEIQSDLPLLAFTEEENRKFQTLHETERSLFFFELWTLKESYVKATGKGLSEGLNTLEILMNKEITSITKDGRPVQAYFEKPECIEGYTFSICSLSENLSRDMKVFPLHEFTREAKKILMRSKAQLMS